MLLNAAMVICIIAVGRELGIYEFFFSIMICEHAAKYLQKLKRILIAFCLGEKNNIQGLTDWRVEKHC